ncbi:MAG: glycosyltransferase family 2 protein, partial [Cyanobacteria bacterium P01_G01_bin.49]
RSSKIAQKAGAEVLFEPISGYGRACWRGLQNIPNEIEWILFCDGDGSDDLTQIPQFLEKLADYDFILGDRTATVSGQKVMTPVQHFGNWLASFLIWLGWGYSYHDLGPFRLIRRAALDGLKMQDRGFGWTVEMQVKAIETCLRIAEIPVNYYPRKGGKSKISGTILGSIQAGIIILSTLAKLYLQKTKSNLKILFSSLFLLLGAFLIIPYGDFREVSAVPLFWRGIAIMGIGFMLSWSISAIAGLWFWIVTLATRLLLIPMYPGDDIWRYLWEGYLQTNGISPYNFAPNAVKLISYRTEWWDLINHPDVSAIYPPIAQLGFWGIAAISPTILLFKLAFVGADLIICWLLSQRFSYQQTLLYAWNPLIIYSFAGGGHYDSWFILPLGIAWFIFDSAKDQSNLKSTFILSGLFLGISVAIKWISLPILIFFTWQAWIDFNLIFALIIVLITLLPLFVSSLPFCSLNSCPLVPTSSTFVSHGRSAELFPHLLALFWEGSRQFNWIYGIPLIIAIIFLLWKKKTFQTFTANYFFALLTFSPIIHAWYFTWIIPFSVTTRNLGVRLISLSAFIYFVLQYRKALGDESWLLKDGERLFLWLPFLLGYIWTIWDNQQKKIKT